MLEIHPVTRERWNDLVALFATSPVTSACWCMWPRVPMGEMHTRTPEQNQRDLRAIVDAGAEPGMLALQDGEAVGWCSIGPLADYGRFSALDERVWLLGCLYVRSALRGSGVARVLVDAALAHAAEHGAAAVEGPPRGWRPDDDPASSARVTELFRSAGFRDVDDKDSAGAMRRNLA